MKTSQCCFTNEVFWTSPGTRTLAEKPGVGAQIGCLAGVGQSPVRLGTDSTAGVTGSPNGPSTGSRDLPSEQIAPLDALKHDAALVASLERIRFWQATDSVKTGETAPLCR